MTRRLITAANEPANHFVHARKMVALIVFAMLCCCDFAHAGEPPQERLVKHERAVALCLFGGNVAPGRYPGDQRIEDFSEWAKLVAPRFEKYGIKRVHWQMPAGLWPIDNGPTMRPDQWLLAEWAGAPYADRQKLRHAVAILEMHGVEENIFYIGGPALLLDPVNELPRCVEPFLAAGQSASIGLDACFARSAWQWPSQWASPDSPWRAALVELRQRCKVYVEPRLSRLEVAAGLGELVDGTMAHARYDVNHAHKFELDDQPGETFRIMDSPEKVDGVVQWRKAFDAVNEWPPHITPVLRGHHNWGADFPEEAEAK